ncbi:hypothetical protein BpHYR1_011850, partial [Brachionus plicatilis]
SLESKALKIFSDQDLLIDKPIGEKSYSIDFEKEKNLLIGSVKKKVFTWNITQSTAIWSQNEAEETRAITFLNQTHFIAGFKHFFVIYDCSNLNSKLEKTDSTNIGRVYDLKILHEKQKILIASHEGYISVFDLISYNFLKKNQIADKIWAIDAFDQNLIVSQCENKDVCLYELDSLNELKELKRCSEEKEIFSIKILNENKAVFGGDKFLKIWNISNNQIIQSITDVDKVWGLDVFSEQIIATGDEKDFVKFWNMTNYSNFKTIDTGSKVYYLKNLNGALISSLTFE